MNESRMLYRYISFEELVDINQKQALTFVLPEVWEDPTEKILFDLLIERINDIYMQTLLEIMKWQTFCQCWTLLEESDAMWRIYSYNNRSIRISAFESDLLSLREHLYVRDITYSNNPIDVPDDLDKTSPIFGARIGDLTLEALSRKRTAFDHEREVRLIYPLTIEKDAIFDYLLAYFSYYNNNKMVEMLCNDHHTIDYQDYSKVCKFLNVGESKRKTTNISISSKPNIIKGVMVHPFAPEWYADTVKTYCDNHSIPFEGKSTLYELGY